MNEKPAIPIKMLARYEPEAVYIGSGDYVAECVRVDDGDYYLAAEVDAEIERLRAKAEASASRVKRLEKMLSVYQAAVNKIDDSIEYSLLMPSKTKAELYAILANLTATLAEELTNDQTE